MRRARLLGLVWAVLATGCAPLLFADAVGVHEVDGVVVDGVG